MEIRRVKEIMIPLSQYPHLPYWFTVRQAIAVMEKSELEVDERKSLPRAVLVFDEKYRLVGVVRRRDILRKLEPPLPDALPAERAEAEGREAEGQGASPSDSKPWLDEMREKAERPISEIMSPIDVTISSEAPMVAAIYKMVDHDLSIIPVMKDDKVVGVMRSVDVFHEVAKLLL